MWKLTLATLYVTHPTDFCTRQELYFISPDTINNDQGQLKKPTPTSTAARLPACAFADSILYLPFQTIVSKMTTNSLGNYVYTLPSCCGEVCASSCCIAVVQHIRNKRLHHPRSCAVSN